MYGPFRSHGIVKDRYARIHRKKLQYQAKALGCPINCFAQAMIREKREHHPGSGVNFQRNASGDSGSWIHRKHMKSWAGALGGSNHAVWRVVGRKASHHPRSRPIRRPHGQLLGCIRKQVKTSDQAFDRHDPTSKKGGLNGAVLFQQPRTSYRKAGSCIPAGAGDFDPAFPSS